MIEQTMLSAWSSTFQLLPLSFLVGVLVMHFVSNGFGVLWLVLAGIELDQLGFSDAPNVFSYALAAVVMWFLAQRVFTNRSVYAMMGLGTVGFLVVTVIHTVSFSLRGVGVSYLASLPAEWAIFLVALFVSFLASRRISVFMRTIFLVRNV